MKILIQLFIACSLTCILGTPNSATAEQHFPVKRCMNLGNDLDAPSFGAWGYTLKKSYIDDIAAAGFDTVRVPVRWHNRTGPGPEYTIDEALFERVTNVINWALAAKLQVILDIHHFADLNTQPEKNRKKLLRLWQQIATRYQDLPNSVYFEVINEPHDNFNGDIMRSIVTEAVQVIRQSNPTRQLILGGDNWNSLASLNSIPVLDDPNIVHTFHYYNPFTFTHQKTSWTRLKDSPTAYWGSVADKQQLKQEIMTAVAHKQQSGRPVLIGEFGAYQQAPYKDMIDYIKAARTTFEAAELPWCVWNFASSFPMYDIKTNTWLPDRLWALGLLQDGPSDRYLGNINKTSNIPLASP